MKLISKRMFVGVSIVCMSILSINLFAHGDVTPQPVNTEGLEDLGDEWKERNPYSGNELAIEIGKGAYGQNCARCHGLGGISGGINPDLRMMKHDAEDDAWYVMRVRNGAIRNGITYMPVFADSDAGPLSQEALWAIWSYVESIQVDE